MRKHEHRWDEPHRGRRRCKACNAVQYQVRDQRRWAHEITLSAFANKWLPAVSGTEPQTMMQVEVAFPFEWNCYESWNPVWRVRFDFPDGIPTRMDAMNGWQSGWQECWIRIDVEAEEEYARRTGRMYDIGDNTYEEMRRIIQA